jgi:biopolymer transport protein ExbB
MIPYLLDAFTGPGAAFMWTITGVLAVGLAVLLERCWVLFVRNRVDLVAVKAAVQVGDARAAATAAGRSELASVLEAGAGCSGPEAAWDAMGAAAVEAEEALRGRVSYLATIGNVATMLGLLGTVYGLILAFGALGDTSAGERAVLLSEGISTAMATTAYGLLVGIPALAAHAWLDNRARATMASIEASAGRLVAHLRGGAA